MNFKKLLSLALILVLAGSFLFAQEKSEVTVEEQYLSTIEGVIIKELTNSDSRDNKLVALQYISDALKEKRISPEIQYALNTLAGEGIFNPMREDGRLANNYPDIRKRLKKIDMNEL